eukprot:Seg7107.2 transcript_id=Seg7107.2/GoldUCD/mRNA.D3Y31 product="hypothetical protein" protein_id=Seg7107.2/GoldUCD/D3Y31
MEAVRELKVLVVLIIIPCVSCIFTPLTVEIEGRDQIITWYFRNGFGYMEILSLLANYHNINMSLRTLHRILRQLNLGRKMRIHRCPINRILIEIRRELTGSGCNIGYREMHQRLISKGFQVDRDSVRIVLKILDPEGVELRSRHRLRRRRYVAKGPNFIWHIDGNDKLLPFGFAIHGAIDGYSRKILWLLISPTSKNPAIIANHFLQLVKRIDGVPIKIRADRGVENSRIAGIQRFLRRNHNDESAGMGSFIFGKSTSNQRIESWWSYLRRNQLTWWMNFFKDLRDQGFYDDSNPVHVESLRFCFYPILQDELYDVVYHWNHHKIRPVRTAESPSGRPDVLFFLPEEQDTRDYKQDAEYNEVVMAEQLFAGKRPTFCCKDDFAELACILIVENDLQLPRTASEAKMLYLELNNLINDF